MTSRAAHARNLWSATLGLIYRLRVHGRHHASDATVIVYDGAGAIAIPALRAALPRPVEVLGADIPVTPPGIDALRSAQRVSAGGSLIAGQIGDPVLTALIASAGAFVCPVVIVGAHGRVVSDPPRLGSRVEVYVGASHELPARPGTVCDLRGAREQVRQVLDDHEHLVHQRRGAA